MYSAPKKTHEVISSTFLVENFHAHVASIYGIFSGKQNKVLT